MAEPGSEAVTVMRLAHRDGGWRWCEVRTSNQLQDPFIEGFLVNFHDISEKKEATDAARFAITGAGVGGRGGGRQRPRRGRSPT